MLLAAGIGSAYLVSTILRALLRPPSSFAPETKTLERALSGGYEGPISLTAALTVAAIFLKFHGAPALFGLLAEAEALFLAGLFFKQAYPRQLAAALFAGGLGKMLIVDIPAGGTAKIGNWNFKPWTPVAAPSALLFYINRALRSVDTFYGYAGSAVLALILGFEMPRAVCRAELVSSGCAAFRVRMVAAAERFPCAGLSRRSARTGRHRDSSGGCGVRLRSAARAIPGSRFRARPC